MTIAAAVTVSYLLGAIPFSFLIGRLVYGVDIRKHGSGNVGATNLGRTCGWRAGVAGLLLDAAKGWAAVAVGGSLAGALQAGDRTWLLVLGACAMIGHVAPVFLLGQGGGKGVATGAGVFLAIEPAALGIALVVFTATVALTRYVSLGSVLAALSLPAVLVARDGRPLDPVVVLTAIIALGVAYKHRANLARIREGTESRLQRSGAALETGPADSKIVGADEHFASSPSSILQPAASSFAAGEEFVSSPSSSLQPPASSLPASDDGGAGLQG